MRLIYRYPRAVDYSRHIGLEKFDFNKTRVLAQTWLSGRPGRQAGQAGRAGRHKANRLGENLC
jgi:hypothetical protein